MRAKECSGLGGFFCNLFSGGGWAPWVFRAILVCSLPLFIGTYHDLNRHFLWTPDWEWPIVYNAILLNSGLPNEFPGHIGYGLFYLLAKWFRLLHAVGVLGPISVADLLQARDEALVQALTFWARVLELGLCGILLVITMSLATLVSGSRLLGFLAAMAFAGSHAINIFAVTLRSELPSAVFIALAGLLLLWAVRRHGERPTGVLGALAGAGACVIFAAYSKIAALPALLFLPLIPLAFLPFSAAARAVPPLSRSAVAVVMAAAALAVLAVAAPIVGAMGPNAWWYNGLIALYVIGAMTLYGRLRRLPLVDMAAGCAAILGGMALAQYLLLIEQHAINTVPVVNHLDYLLPWSSVGSGKTVMEYGEDGAPVMSLARQGLPIVAMLGKLLSNVGQVFTKSIFDFCWNCRKTEAAYVFAVLGFLPLMLWGKGEDRLRGALLLAMVVGIEAIMRFHTFNQFYYAYVEVWLFALFALVAARLAAKPARPALRAAVRTGIAGICLWLWQADGRNKMLWASYAAHIEGSSCQMADSMTPRLKDYVRPYCNTDVAPGEMWKDGPAVPWKGDSRPSFLGSPKPWRSQGDGLFWPRPRG